MSTQHSIRAEKFLADKKQAEWHDETLWLVRAKRDRLSKQVPEWEKLRDAACAIKMYSNSHLAELLTEFEANAVKNGAIVHWAKDAEEYRTTVLDILRSKGVRHFIKSKSMLAEECELNPFLEANGIETVESDLGERILQLMHLAPSHIVLPAIHIKREQVGKLFEKEMGTEQGNFDPTYLTHAARKNLRQKFIHAEAAMTGANFAVCRYGYFTAEIADSGFRAGENRARQGIARRVHAPAGTFGHRAAVYHVYFALQETERGRRISHHNSGQRAHRHTCRCRTPQGVELSALRSLHEYMPGLQAQRRIFIHLLHSRSHRHQSWHVEIAGKIQ